MKRLIFIISSSLAASSLSGQAMGVGTQRNGEALSELASCVELPCTSALAPHNGDVAMARIAVRRSGALNAHAERFDAKPAGVVGRGVPDAEEPNTGGVFAVLVHQFGRGEEHSS